jgi:asparagine synthetase B (glutamine-hydrolysing)
LPPADAYARKHAYGLFESDARSALYSHDFATEVRNADPFAGFRLAYHSCSSKDPLDRALYVDVKTYLADDIMTKVDRMSMAVSLEAREPLLDHKLLEFAASVPTCLKLKNGRSKYLLRRLLERRIPSSIVPSTASKRRPAPGCAVHWRRWSTRCSPTGACARAASSTTAPSPDCGTSTALAGRTTATGSGAW